jgi:hypothetical protein
MGRGDDPVVLPSPFADRRGIGCCTANPARTFINDVRSLVMWWGIGGVAVLLWLVLFIWLGLRTLRNGHGWMFFLGIFFPILWIFGAFAGPADQPG